jgi:hypothetical protein
MWWGLSGGRKPHSLHISFARTALTWTKEYDIHLLQNQQRINFLILTTQRQVLNPWPGRCQPGSPPAKDHHWGTQLHTYLVLSGRTQEEWDPEILKKSCGHRGSRGARPS